MSGGRAGRFARRAAPVLLVLVALPMVVVTIYLERIAERDLRAVGSLQRAEQLLQRQQKALGRFDRGDLTDQVIRERLTALRISADRQVADALTARLTDVEYREIKRAQSAYRLAVDQHIFREADTGEVTARYRALQSQLVDSERRLVRIGNRDEGRAERTLLAGLAMVALTGTGTMQGIHAEKLRKTRLRERAAAGDRLQQLVEGASDLILVVGPDRLVCWSSADGARAGDYQGADLAAIVDGEQSAELLAWVDERRKRAQSQRTGSPPMATEDDRRWHGSTLVRVGDQWRHHSVSVTDRLDVAEVGGLIVTCQDQTEVVLAAERIRYEAMHDPVTELQNRHAFDHAMARLRAATTHADAVGLVLLDIDLFATLNRDHGTGAGDDVLRELARRLSSRASASCEVFRIGNDEFAVLTVGSDPGWVAFVANTMQQACAEPVLTRAGQLSVTVSIGHSELATQGTTVDSLLAHAALALATGRSAGSASVGFHEGMLRNAVRRRDVERGLRSPRLEQDLALLYQPIVSRRGDVVGAEVLLRWSDNDLGDVSPREFIPIAEQAGLIGHISAMVLRRVALDVEEMGLDLVTRPPYVSVNVSPLQLRDEDFPLSILRTLSEGALDPGQIVLEITEGATLDETCLKAIRALHTLGLRLALDDFGTGYASLSTMLSAPFDIVKIDRSFVAEITGRTGPVVGSIIRMAADLGMTSVAEGVESPEQRDLLTEMGCQHYQGYLVSRPAEISALTAMANAAPTAAWGARLDPHPQPVQPATSPGVRGPSPT